MAWDGDDFNAAWRANTPKIVPHPARNGAMRQAAAPDPQRPAIWTDDGAWTEEQIPLRPWVVPGYFMRGSVTVAAGPGGAGKSSMMLSWGVAAALGEAFGAFIPPQPCKVLVYNVEDDAEEQRRRLSAVLRSFGRTPMDIAGRVIRAGPSGSGMLVEHDQMMGRIAETAALIELEAAAAIIKPDIIILDPLAEVHNGEENDNTVLRLVIARLRQIARDHNCAVGVLHHTRKGGTAGDVDAIRGAGSLVNAGRAGFTIFPMCEAEAEELGITPDIRRHYIRVDSVKSNYAPATEASWHELIEHTLDNGELIPAVWPWKAPSRSQGPDPDALALVAAEIERGGPGGPYSPRLAPEQERSVAPILAAHGMRSVPAQKVALKALLGMGFSVQRFRTQHRELRNGIRGPNGPAAKWLE